jgi:UDP-N-acetylmuramoyl-tripeptide--D-alanyl-D-alanine ligase
MVRLRLDEIAEKIGGKLLQGAPSLVFEKFNIDSRLTEPGELFFALVAGRNGHDFVPEAIHKGAAGAVVSRKMIFPDKNVGLIQVKDTLFALQELARKVLAENPVKVIGITGSIGKTTTKEFIFQLLSRHFNVLKSEGNFNNQLGLPLSLLKLTKKHQVALLEMAMSGRGEIASLTLLAPPDIAVITNINPVHLQFFESLEGIALAKKEILEGTKNGGKAVLNGDDSLVRKIAEGWKGEKIFFGLEEGNDIRAQKIQKAGWQGMSFELVYGKKQEEMRVPFFYESYLYDLLAAAAVGWTLSLPFEALSGQAKAFGPLPRRGRLIALTKDIRLIDDSYNSNPAALESALKGLAEFPSKRRVAVLGDMLELGEREVEFHRQAGRQVAKLGWNELVTVGSLSKHMAEGAYGAGMKKNQIHSFNDSAEAAEKIESLIREGDLVLVKGSRKIQMEKIVERLKSKAK